MPAPHVIRLRGPWQFEPPPPALPARVKLPMDAADVLGIVAADRSAIRGANFRRHFNRPTGLETHHRVWIVVEHVGAGTTVALNERLLGAVGGDNATAEFDVTDMLEASNQLVLGVTFPRADATGPFGDVRLEIRE